MVKPARAPALSLSRCLHPPTDPLSHGRKLSTASMEAAWICARTVSLAVCAVSLAAQPRPLSHGRRISTASVPSMEATPDRRALASVEAVPDLCAPPSNCAPRPRRPLKSPLICSSRVVHRVRAVHGSHPARRRIRRRHRCHQRHRARDRKVPAFLPRPFVLFSSAHTPQYVIVNL
jgi:hypothetical protein